MFGPDEDKTLTIKPVDRGLRRGRVIEGNRGLPLQLARLPVGVQVDHRQARLLVELKDRQMDREDTKVNNPLGKRLVSESDCQKS